MLAPALACANPAARLQAVATAAQAQAQTKAPEAGRQERLVAAFKDALARDIAGDQSITMAIGYNLPYLSPIDWDCDLNAYLMNANATPGDGAIIELDNNGHSIQVPAEFFHFAQQGFVVVPQPKDASPYSQPDLIDVAAYKAIANPMSDAAATYQQVAVSGSEISQAFTAAVKSMKDPITAAFAAHVHKLQEAAAARRLKELQKRMGEIGQALSQ